MNQEELTSSVSGTLQVVRRPEVSLLRSPAHSNQTHYLHYLDISATSCRYTNWINLTHPPLSGTYSETITTRWSEYRKNPSSTYHCTYLPTHAGQNHQRKSITQKHRNQVKLSIPRRTTYTACTAKYTSHVSIDNEQPCQTMLPSPQPSI